MTKNKLLKSLALIMAITAILTLFCSCSDEEKEPLNAIVAEDMVEDRISFDKKYYYLGYDAYTQNEYYTFFDDGTATYTHVMYEGSEKTFHQEINFKWTYTGEGNCILIHNGTKMIKGEQDEAFGITRIMRVGKDVVYWSASGENTYFICEDATAKIPNYAKMVD